MLQVQDVTTTFLIWQVLLGANQDEGSLFTRCPLSSGSTECADWLATKPIFGGKAGVSRILGSDGPYPRARFVNSTHASADWWAAEHLLGDMGFNCGARRTARDLAAAGAPGVYVEMISPR